MISPKWGYSAAIRHRLSHMARTMVAISAGDFSGKAALRFFTARADTGMWGPTVRPSQPPKAEAMSIDRTRIRL